MQTAIPCRQLKSVPARDFPDGPVLKTALPLQKARTGCLVRGLRSRMLHVADKNRKENEILKKFSIMSGCEL